MALLGLIILGGCGIQLPSLYSGGSGPVADPSVQVSGLRRGPDPLAEFAASAAPGQEGSVNGERVRLARAYNAASGRECREMLLGIGRSERAAVACREADGSFTSARPLLRAGR